jgi:hypothetical protein
MGKVTDGERRMECWSTKEKKVFKCRAIMSEDKERVDWEVQHQLEVQEGMAGLLSLPPPLRDEVAVEE